MAVEGTRADRTVLEGRFVDARGLGLLAAIVAVCVVVGWINPHFLEMDNISIIGLQMSFVAIGALGMTLLLVAGYVDLSVGSIFACSAVVAAYAGREFPWPVALGIGVLTGGVLGLANGLLVRRIPASPLIITLGSLTLLRGVVNVVTQSQFVGNLPPEFSILGQSTPLGLPTAVWITVGLAIAVWFVLHETVAGVWIFALGGNQEATQAAGVNVRKLQINLFVVNGLLVGVAGVLAASRFASADPMFGIGYEFDVLTAVVLGGVAFSGGEGGIVGVILAVVLLGVINSGLVAVGLDPHFSDVVKGAALIIAVAIQQVTTEQRDRYRRMLAMQEGRARHVPEG